MKDKKDNANEMVITLVGKGTQTKLKGSKFKGFGMPKNLILEEDILSGGIKGLDINNKIYFDGTQNEKYEISTFSTTESKNKNNSRNLLKLKSIDIFEDICANNNFCSFEATINLNNFNKTLYNVRNVKKIEDPNRIKQIKKLLREKGKIDKNDELKKNTCTDTGYSFKFKKPQTDTEWNKLLDTMSRDYLSPAAQILYLTCLRLHQGSSLTRDHIDLYAPKCTEQECEDVLNELIGLGYLKNTKIKQLVQKSNASSKVSKKSTSNCHNTYDSNILLEKNVSSMAIGCYIVCIEANKNGVVLKDVFLKNLGWSSSQTDNMLKELEILGYIQKVKVYDENEDKTLYIYLFRKSLNEDFCDVEKEYPNYRIVKK